MVFIGLFASKATACVLLFEAFGSGVLRPDFATGFFGSGFGRFRLVSRWCLGLFTSKAKNRLTKTNVDLRTTLKKIKAIILNFLLDREYPG